MFLYVTGTVFWSQHFYIAFRVSSLNYALYFIFIMINIFVSVWVKIFFHALHWMKENLLEGFRTYYADFWAIIRIKVKEKGRCYPLICLFSTSKHKNLFPSHRIGVLDIISTSKEHFFSRFSIDPSTYSFFISKQRKLSSIHYIEITSHFLFWELVSRWYIAFTDSI